MTLSASVSPSAFSVAPKPATVTPKPIVATPIKNTTSNVGPTAIATAAPRPAATQAQTVTQADIAPTASPAQQAAASTVAVMRPAIQTATAAPAATTTQVTMTPRPQTAAGPAVAQPAPNRIDPMATNTIFSTGTNTSIKLSPAQPATSPVLIKPSQPTTQSPPTQSPAQQSATVATATQQAQSAAAPAPSPQTIQLSPTAIQAAQQAANTGVAAQVKPGNPNANTGVVGPTAQTSQAPNDLQRARTALARWLADAAVYATMDPDARLAAKGAIMANPDSSVAAKMTAALVTASTPQKANDQGVSVIIIPDDTFSGYLGAFTLAKRLLNLPESVNSPSAKTIANSIPALQALINLIDLALAGQALPTDIPAALTDDGPFYTKWWFWTIVGMVGVGGAAYVAHKRRS